MDYNFAVANILVATEFFNSDGKMRSSDEHDDTQLGTGVADLEPFLRGFSSQPQSQNGLGYYRFCFHDTQLGTGVVDQHKSGSSHEHKPDHSYEYKPDFWHKVNMVQAALF